MPELETGEEGIPEPLLAELQQLRTMMNGPWQLPIAYSREGDIMVATLQFKLGFPLDHFSVDDGMRIAEQTIRYSIIGFMLGDRSCH